MMDERLNSPFVRHLSSDGAIAQLGERLNGIQEVGGSTPPGSTSLAITSATKCVGPSLFYFCHDLDIELDIRLRPGRLPRKGLTPMTMPRAALAAVISCALSGGAGATPLSAAGSLPNVAQVHKIAWVCGPDRCWWQGPGPAPGPAPSPGPEPGPGPGPGPGAGPGPGPGAGPGPGPGPRVGRGPGGPCAIIRAACERAGFVHGGARTGNGLQIDCIRPIIEGRPPPARTALPLPQIDPQIVAACRARRGMGGGPPPAGPSEQPPPGYGQPPGGGAPPPGYRPLPGAAPDSGGPPPGGAPPQGNEPENGPMPPPGGPPPSNQPPSGNNPESAPSAPPGNPSQPGGPSRVND